MSDNVTRYSHAIVDGRIVMAYDPCGGFVGYDDFSRLLAENARLRAENEHLSRYVGHNGDCEKWRGGTKCTCGLGQS